MTFLEQLQAHKGGLIRLKTPLYWYDGVRNEIVGRICLLLDASSLPKPSAAATTPSAAAAATAVVATAAGVGTAAAFAVALLLIEGQPQWIWLAEKDIDLLVNDPPTN